MLPMPTPPMPGAPGGGMSPPMMGGMPGLAGGTGAATMPGAMKPQGISGVAGVKAAIELLQKAMVDLPLGSPLHTKVIKFVSDASKELADSDQAPHVAPNDIVQQLAAAARAAQGGGGPQPMMPPEGGAQGGDPSLPPMPA